jgi:hypothetical protein
LHYRKEFSTLSTELSTENECSAPFSTVEIMDFKKVFHIIHQVIHMAVGLCHPNYATKEGEIPPKTMCFCAKRFSMTA